MPNLWERGVAAQWTSTALASDLVLLGGADPAPLAAVEALPDPAPPLLVRTAGARGEAWALLARADGRTAVNGRPLTTGVRILGDRDAISLAPDRTLYFGAAAAARVEPFPGAGEAPCCARCRLPLERGRPAVRCPGLDCGLWHHQCDDQPCWTYTERCAGCGRPTDAQTGPQWTPAQV